jgi:hypothetical protein
MANRTVCVIDESGTKAGYTTKTEADDQVSKGLAKRESACCIRMLPPNPRVSGEHLPGRLRIKQSGPCGPIVVQVE